MKNQIPLLRRPKKRPLYELGLLCILGFLVVTLNRCGNTPTSTSQPAEGTFTNVYAIIKSHNCVECHAPGKSATVDNGVQLDFSTQALAYQTLLASTVNGMVSKADCSSVKIVTASDASKSYLAAVLFTDYNKANFGGVTGCQPYNGDLQRTNLSSSEETTVINWIQSGAQNN